MYIALILLFIAFGIMTYQDLKYRHIHMALPILVFAVVFFQNQEQINLWEMTKSFLFLILNFTMISAYFSIKHLKVTNPFKNHIGFGDLLFLIGVIPLFSFRNYILFFITGMMFSLVLYMLFMNKYVQKTIPLAGYLSIYIMALMIPNLVLSINLFYDFII